MSPRVYAKLPPDSEFRGLLRTHGSYGAVARVLGCSKTAVADRCKRLGLKSPDRRGGLRVCAFCRITSEDRTILRFGLVHSRQKTRYAGTVFLCEPCWRAATGAGRGTRTLTARQGQHGLSVPRLPSAIPAREGYSRPTAMQGVA